MLNTQDSLTKRFLFKVLTNLVGLACGLVTQAIIPRGLGPRFYGDFSFLSSFFMQVVGFFEMGTSIGFFTKLSSRPEEYGLVAFYLRFCGLIFCLLVGFVLLGALTPVRDLFWPGQESLFIFLATIWAILNWVVMLLNKMADAYGVTVQAEIASLLQKALGLLLMALLFASGSLNLWSLFGYHYIMFLLLGLAFCLVMSRKGFPLQWRFRLTREQSRGYWREFYRYSHPLLVYASVGLVAGIMDRWLLQVFAGSREQGFFGLSYQVGALCFLFTGAMTPLLTREFSVAFSDKNLPRMAELFRRYIPVLFSVAAYFSCFLAIQGDMVVRLMGGERFAEATTVVAIMALYPIHQTYGQLSGAVFYATGQTALYRNIGVVFMVLGLPATYFIIAPPGLWGLGGGASGLALKMVLFQVICVNVQLYYNAKLLQLSFGRFLGHQAVCVGSLLGLSYLVSAAVEFVPFGGPGGLLKFLTSGILYTLLVVLLAQFFPALFGVTREDLDRVKMWLPVLSGRSREITG